MSWIFLTLLQQQIWMGRWGYTQNQIGHALMIVETEYQVMEFINYSFHWCVYFRISVIKTFYCKYHAIKLDISSEMDNFLRKI